VHTLLLRGDRQPFWNILESDIEATADKYGVDEQTVVDAMKVYAPGTLKYDQVKALTEKILSEKKSQK
jgi:hypothetical protein